MVVVCAKRFAPLVKSGHLELACAGAEALPYEADRFTKACTVNTIYFWPDASVPLKELARVLRPGGRLVVSFSPPAAIEKLPGTKHGFTLREPEEVARLLEEAGFGSRRDGLGLWSARRVHLRDRHGKRGVASI